MSIRVGAEDARPVLTLPNSDDTKAIGASVLAGDASVAVEVCDAVDPALALTAHTNTEWVAAQHASRIAPIRGPGDAISRASMLSGDGGVAGTRARAQHAYPAS